MATERLVDITILGATDFTGKCVLVEFIRINQNRELSWAVAGANEKKLRQVLDWASKKTGQDVSGVPLIIAKCNNQQKLLDMAKRTRVVINCCSNFRQSIARACDRNGAHHLEVVDEEEQDVILLSKVIDVAQEMVNLKECGELDRIYGRKISPVVPTLLRESYDEELGHPERRKKSPFIGKSTFREIWTFVGKRLDKCKIPMKKWENVAMVVLVALLGFGFIYVPTTQKHKGSEEDSLSESEVSSVLAELKILTSKFISPQSDLSLQIFTGFKNVIQSPKRPAVYLLLSDRKSEKTSSCVVEIITSVANTILPNYGRLFLNGSELSNAKSEDFGVLVDTITENIVFSRVVVVSDIHKIPHLLAAGFHLLIDEEVFRIKDTVYIFTMTIEQIDGGVKPKDVVEKTLFKSWSKLKLEILRPLVARVTETILNIVPERKIDACPLKTDSMELRIP